MEPRLFIVSRRSRSGLVWVGFVLLIFESFTQVKGKIDHHAAFGVTLTGREKTFANDYKCFQFNWNLFLRKIEPTLLLEKGEKIMPIKIYLMMALWWFAKTLGNLMLCEHIMKGEESLKFGHLLRVWSSASFYCNETFILDFFENLQQTFFLEQNCSWTFGRLSGRWKWFSATLVTSQTIGTTF